MKFALLLCSILSLSLDAFSQEKITADDLYLLIGNWEGSITYLDYQSGKPFTMQANVSITQGKSEDQLMLKNTYPKEPKANSSDKIKISRNGTLLNKNAITSRQTLENGNIQIRTEQKGKDDNQKALMRYTYIVGTDDFLIRKEVQFDEAGEWIKRSEFSYQRKK